MGTAIYQFTTTMITIDMGITDITGITGITATTDIGTMGTGTAGTGMATAATIRDLTPVRGPIQCQAA